MGVNDIVSLVKTDHTETREHRLTLFGLERGVVNFSMISEVKDLLKSFHSPSNCFYT